MHVPHLISPSSRNQAWSYLHRRSMRATRPRIVSRRSSNQEEESFQFMDPVEKKRLRSYLQKYYNKISRSNSIAMEDDVKMAPRSDLDDSSIVEAWYCCAAADRLRRNVEESAE